MAVNYREARRYGQANQRWFVVEVTDEDSDDDWEADEEETDDEMATQ